MTIAINGTGTVTGITAGGLPDAIITQAELATGVAGTGPAFSAYGNAYQTVATSTWTKVACNTKEFDTATCYDTTNYRFTPNVAGYYQFQGLVVTSPSATGYVFCRLYKNGTTYRDGLAIPNSNQGPEIFVSTVFYMNGTTDYVELYMFQTSGSNMTAGSPSSVAPFQGYLVRAA